MAGQALAQTGGMSGMEMNGMGMKGMTHAKDAGKTHNGTGVVKTINPVEGSITVAHEPIKTLNWPAMSMSFKVQDRKLLDQVKPGDRIRFTVVQAGKDYVITNVRQ